MSSFLENDFRLFISEIENQEGDYAQKVFAFQSESNKTYRSWLNHTSRPKLNQDAFPYSFLPISFFKNQNISSVHDISPTETFTSSGTTSHTPSRHPLYRPDFYRQNSLYIFEKYFKKSIADFRILALLPSYLERKSSSLVHMVQDWMDFSPQLGHAFFLHDMDGLLATLRDEVPTLLIGVTYALLDLAQIIDFPLAHCLVIETGGMKNTGREWTKSELHQYLYEKLGTEVYSEYGMTELLSQSYMKRGERFQAPPQMKILIRDEDDPLTIRTSGRGAINIIDLANMDTISFIATDDLGLLYPDGSFEILGRIDAAEVRGCSQLYFLT